MKSKRIAKTWNDAASRWLLETAHKRTHGQDRAKLQWIALHWSSRRLHDIDRDAIESLGRIKCGVTSGATANRYLALIRGILRRAVREWEWLDRVPFIRLYPEAARRVRWIDPQQARRLLEELPEHQRSVVLFALATGLRHANVVGMTWDRIKLKNRSAWCFGDETKNGEDLHIPLNDLAMSILEQRKGKHRTHVFTYQGKPLKRVNTRAWYKAKERAGIENFRWHDLRHTWASWLVQEGVPLYAVQEMGGWKTASMVRKYAHLSPPVNLRYSQAIDVQWAASRDD